LTAVCKEPETEETVTFGSSNDAESTVITPKFEGPANIKEARKSRAKETKPRAKKPNNVKECWVSHDIHGRSLYIRPSDGQFVYLECCFPGCGKTDFKNIRSVMRHMSDKRQHNAGRKFFRNHTHVIEVCGKLPPDRQALREAEEEHRLIEPQPPHEQIAYESESSIPFSSLRQSATAHAIEQDSDKLNSREAPSITSLPISDYNFISSIIPTMGTHDVTIKKEVTEDVDKHPHVFHMAQSKGPITHDCLSANEIERVALPEYVSSMSYDTDDDDVDTAIHEAIQHRATARQRYIPELASLDAGQMGLLVNTLPGVLIEREDEGIEAEIFGQPTIAKVPATGIHETDRRIGDITKVVGKPDIETELADTSVLFGNKTLVSESDLNAELPDQPFTANVAAGAQIQETDRRIADTTDLEVAVADSHKESEEQLGAQASSNGNARHTDPGLSKDVSHKRALSTPLALLNTTAQKRLRYDSYTFGPSSC